jgi:hypothetical protein
MQHLNGPEHWLTGAKLLHTVTKGLHGISTPGSHGGAVSCGSLQMPHIFA